MKQLTIALLMMFCCATANAQNAETTMQDIYEKGGELVKMLEERYEQEIVRIEYDLLFGTKESIRTLSTLFQCHLLLDLAQLLQSHYLLSFVYASRLS